MSIELFYLQYIEDAVFQLDKKPIREIKSIKKNPPGLHFNYLTLAKEKAGI